MNQNPGNKLSAHDRVELERYIRFLIFKISQVIVQSRFGEKKKYINKRSSEHDWFTLAIEDNEEIKPLIMEACKSISPLKDFCLSIEILLKTAEGDVLGLETWSLHMNASDVICKPYVSSHTPLSNVYSQMTLLLKSIISVTRVTPAYKLSCGQSAETYVMLYKIYSGEQQVNLLGEHFQENKIGEVLTPLGTLKMLVAYRSKSDMKIAPSKVEKESPFMVKSDYFKPDMSPKRGPSNGVRMDKNFNCQTSPKDFRKIGAFASPLTPLKSDVLEELEILQKPILNLSRSKVKRKDKKPEDDDANADKNANLSILDNKRDENEVDYNCNANEAENQKMAGSDGSGCGDFVMVEMKPPFAGCESDNELSAFFRECQRAPSLASFASQPTLEEQVIDITSQLAKFETSMNDFDNFVDSICQIESEK